MQSALCCWCDIYATCRDKKATRVACWMARRARSSLGRAANAWVAALSGSLRILLLLVVAVNRFRTWSAGGAIYHIDNGCIFLCQDFGRGRTPMTGFRAAGGAGGADRARPARSHSGGGTILSQGYAREVRGRATGALFANLGDLKTCHLSTTFLRILAADRRRPPSSFAGNPFRQSACNWWERGFDIRATCRDRCATRVAH